MELYTMRYAIAVADYQNFSLAAQAIHLGQPALSQQISKLERELGVVLFHRNSRGVTLTEAGQQFVQRARKVVEMADALEAEMSLYAGVKKGTLNLGIITSLQCINFGDLLSAFCGSYPEISVNIQQGGTHYLIQALLERNLDAAFLNKPVSGFPNALEFAKLGEDVYSVAVSALHPLARRGEVSLSELREEKFIFHQPGQAAAELCLNSCREAGFEPNIVCRSSSPTTGLYMVRGGLGVALLPSEEFGSRPLDGVAELKLKERITKEVGILWHRDAVSPLIRTVVSFAKSW